MGPMVVVGVVGKTLNPLSQGSNAFTEEDSRSFHGENTGPRRKPGRLTHLANKHEGPGSDTTPPEPFGNHSEIPAPQVPDQRRRRSTSSKLPSKPRPAEVGSGTAFQLIAYSPAPSPWPRSVTKNACGVNRSFSITNDSPTD